MITYTCDVCGQVITERFIVVIDNKEHDICKACKAKTVGKIKNGRPVEVKPMIIKEKEYIPSPYIPYIPWYEPYKQPTWVGPTCSPNTTGDAMPQPARIWCSSDTRTVMPSLETNTGTEYMLGNCAMTFTQ